MRKWKNYHSREREFWKTEISSFRLCHNSHTSESKRSKSHNLYMPGARVIQGWKKPAQKFVLRQVLEDAGQKNWSNGHIEVLEKLSKLKELPSNIQLQILITGQHFFSLLREITQPWIPWVFTPGWVQWLWKCECCRFFFVSIKFSTLSPRKLSLLSKLLSVSLNNH